MNLTLLCCILSVLVSVSRAMCPFARMMNQYNFSGEWIMQHPEEANTKYLLHVCHPEGNEIFFGISNFSQPDSLIGFGGGNWSQWNMGIGGLKYMLNGVNNSIDESGFIVTMNQEGHRWYLKDLKYEYDLDIHSQDYGSHDLCAVPYGFDKRVEKNWKIRQVLKKKRYIPREIERREKKIRKLQGRNAKGDKDEKIKSLLDEIEELRQRPEEPITDGINPDLVTVPTLFNTTFANDQIKVTFIDNNTLCMVEKGTENTEYTVYNVTSWYGGVAFKHNWKKNDGSFGTQFYVQFEPNTLLSSTYVMSGENESGYSVNLTLQAESEAIPCQSTITTDASEEQTNQCGTESGEKCEL